VRQERAGLGLDGIAPSGVRKRSLLKLLSVPGSPPVPAKPADLERVSPIIDPTVPAPLFTDPMSAVVFEMAVRASVAAAEAFVHVDDEYDSWHWEGKEQLEAVEEFCDEIINLEGFDLARASELRHAVSSAFWAAAMAHPQRCSLCALEHEHALVLAAAP
jgi:hypothetical protein